MCAGFLNEQKEIKVGIKINKQAWLIGSDVTSWSVVTIATSGVFFITHIYTHTRTHILTLSSADMPLSVSFRELHGNCPVTLYMLRVRLKQKTHEV